MPIDEAILGTTITDLEKKLNTARAAYKNVQGILAAANGIKEQDDPDNQGQKIMPKDPMLGGEIDSARRQAIYDKVVADAATL